MKWLKALGIMIVFAGNVCAAEDISIALEKAPVNMNDIQSIKRGAKFFATTCMACHTLIYLRYNKLAEEAGITYEKMPVNVKTWPLGVKPPDLSLEANVRSVDWIYTYLHSFYTDTTRPYGVNNLVFPNTAMMGVLVPQQGQLVLASDFKLVHGLYDRQPQWYNVLEYQSQGSMSPEQFDQLVTDIVNFLDYAADPYQVEQHRLGYYVLAFLLIFFVLVFLLKQAYWRDVK
jgi:ubiquinol-cytochrome c reductase cytochrome c1 subunit